MSGHDCVLSEAISLQPHKHTTGADRRGQGRTCVALQLRSGHDSEASSWRPVHEDTFCSVQPPPTGWQRQGIVMLAWLGTPPIQPAVPSPTISVLPPPAQHFCQQSTLEVAPLTCLSASASGASRRRSTPRSMARATALPNRGMRAAPLVRTTDCADAPALAQALLRARPGSALPGAHARQA